jgi:hypothetical protein
MSGGLIGRYAAPGTQEGQQQFLSRLAEDKERRRREHAQSDAKIVMGAGPWDALTKDGQRIEAEEEDDFYGEWKVLRGDQRLTAVLH